MLGKLTATALLALLLPVANAAEGMLTLASKHSVSETVDRLEAALAAADFRIFARVDHGAGAASVGKELAPSQLLIFGKPQAGTVLMQAAATVGIDLPMKYLVWEDEEGQVHIGWNDAAWLAQRHGVDAAAPVLKTMTGALRKFAGEAAS